MSKSQKEVTLVGLQGVKLPFTTGTLVSESGDSLVFHVTETVGRGRGAKTVKRQYVIPRCSLSFYYSDDEVVAGGEVYAKESSAPKAPKAAKAPKGAKRKSKVEESDNSEVKDAIMTALQEAGEPVGMSGLKEATQLDPAVLRPVLKELEEAGKVRRSGERRGTVYFVKGASKPKKADAAPKAAKAPKGAKRKSKVEESDNSEVKDAIMTALQEAGEPVGMGTIKGSTGLDPAVLRPVIKELEEAGTVVREGEKRGTVYSMANGVRSAKKAAAPKKRITRSDDAKDAPFKGASLFDDSI